MKRYIILILMFALMACNNEEPIILEQLIAKWTINSDDIEFIEFNVSNTYLLVRKQSTPQDLEFGHFEIIENEIILDSGRKISEVQISNNEIEFTLEDDLNPITDLVGVKADEAIESNSVVEEIFKTWRLVTLNGQPAISPEFEFNMLLSKAGTFFTSNIKDDENQYVRSWIWSSIDDQVFCHYNVSPTECTIIASGSNFGKVTQLSEKELIIHQDQDIYEYEAVNF